MNKWCAVEARACRSDRTVNVKQLTPIDEGARMFKSLTGTENMQYTSN